MNTTHDSLALELERKELDQLGCCHQEPTNFFALFKFHKAPNGVPPAHIYQQLLAIYLLRNELCFAKFLWKRIPSSTKQATPELSKIWAVGQKLWLRDFPGVYDALNQDWSPVVRDLMKEVYSSVQQRAIELISHAYTSIGIVDFSGLVGIPPNEALVKVKKLGWGYDEPSNMVLPVAFPEKPVPPISSEAQLQELASYVSFLEM